MWKTAPLALRTGTEQGGSVKSLPVGLVLSLLMQTDIGRKVIGTGVYRKTKAVGPFLLLQVFAKLLPSILFDPRIKKEKRR